MPTMMRRLSPFLTVVAFVAALLLGGMPAAPTAAQPVSDVRDVKIKVRDFKADCKNTGGTATSLLMDDDTSIVRCTGGTFDRTACVYTSTTSDCLVDRKDPRQPGTVSQADDTLGVAIGTGARAAAADAAQAAPTKGKHGTHDQQSKKHRRR